ncbi:MAG: multidrug transporter [Lacisediminihabitans sp.]
MHEMSKDEQRHDQLTAAPKSTEADAAPRIEVTAVDAHTTRIDVAETAAVRPGKATPKPD